MGYQFKVVTDHQALEFLQTQKRLSGCQTRWFEYLARFDMEITYVKGISNKVANALSCYYEYNNWDKPVPAHQYIDADKHLDPAEYHLLPERLDKLKDEKLLAKLVPVNEDEGETFLALRELKKERVQLAAKMA